VTGRTQGRRTRLPVAEASYRSIALVAVACFATACSGDDGPTSQDAGGAGQGGASGGTGLLAGATAVAGAVSGSAGATNGGSAGTSQGGVGGNLTGQELKDAEYVECDRYCARVTAACSTVKLGVCTDTCHQQADNFAASGKCAPEHYAVLQCINDTMMVATITCTAEGWEVDRCQTELATYNSCVGLGP
jgi:hypothetical protein